MCITDVQQSPPGALLWPRGNRGVGHLRSLMSGLAVVHKKALGPQKTLAQDAPTQHCLHPLPVYPSLAQWFPPLTGSLLLFVKSAGVYMFR